MRCFRLIIGLVCLAGLAGCDQFDPTLPVGEAVGAPAPWGAVTPSLNADSDKAEYLEQLSAHHREGHDGGPDGDRCNPNNPRPQRCR